MNTSQWPQQQEIVVKPNEEITIPKQLQHEQQQQQLQQQKPRPQQKEQNLNCPRCNSTNTKFCYYNNYSLTQPRYFCKTCRRYWTNGGSLRNIPVGGGSRKNKRPSSSSNTSSPSKKQDLNLTFPISTHQDFTTFSHHEFAQMTKMPSSTPTTSTITTTTNTNIPQHHLSHLELLNGFSGTNTCGSSRGYGSFMHVGANFPISTNNVGKIRDLQHENDMTMNNMVNYNASTGFHDHMQGLKQSSNLNFTLDHHDHGNIGGSGGGYDRNFQNGVMQESNNVNASSDGRVLFPFEDLKQQASINTNAQDVEEHDHVASSGYWTGMLGGGSW